MEVVTRTLARVRQFLHGLIRSFTLTHRLTTHTLREYKNGRRVGTYWLLSCSCGRIFYDNRDEKSTFYEHMQRWTP